MTDRKRASGRYRWRITSVIRRSKAETDPKLAAVQIFAGNRQKRQGVGMHILLIEDDAVMSALLEEWLASAGFEVTSTTGAVAPLPRLPNAILFSIVDVRGPGALRIDSLCHEYPRVPVVVLSGQQPHSLVNSAGKIGGLGVSAVLAKPFTKVELLTAVASALDHGG